MADATHHTITAVPLTDEERKRLRGEAGAHLGAWGCLTALFLPASAILVWGSAQLAGLFGERLRDAGTVFGVVIALVFVVRGVRLLQRELAPRRTAATADLASGTADEISVEGARWVVLQGDDSSIQPALCGDIGGGRLLVLVGPWLRDPAQFGAPSDAQSEATPGNTVNGLGAPHAFPATEFSVRRFRTSGDVLGIVVRGPYAEPKTGPGIAAKAGRYPDSAVIEGKLTRVEHALAEIVDPTV